MSKYHAKKTTVYGITFDSKKEADRYLTLRAMQSRGEISELSRQVKYTLIPSQKLNGKVIYRPVTYKADFEYIKNGQKVVEDVKGVKTKEYIIKKKMMFYIYGIRIEET